MKFTTPSFTTIKESILDFFTGNRSLSATTAKWVAANTAGSLEKNSPFWLLPAVEGENNFAPAND